jgi:hypothetical protein
MTPCANCGAPHDGLYCAQCGEKRRKPGIRLGEVLSDFLGGLFNADAPIPFTLRTFFKGPAALTHSFLAGKRKAYTPPVRYFLFGVAYYYIMRWLLNWDPVDSAVASSGGDPSAATGAMRVNHWMSQNVNLLLPLLLLILASFDRLLFPRTPLRWVERLVHYLFAAGTYLIISSTTLPLAKLLPVFQLFNFIVIFGVIIYATLSVHRRSVWNVSKAVMMTPVAFVVYIALCSVLVAMLLGVPLNDLVVKR